MARGRMISKSLSTSEKFAALLDEAGALAEFCQVLYPLMVTHTDDYGRLQGDVFTVKHLILPASRRTIPEFQDAIGKLCEVGLISTYEVESGPMQGRKVIQVNNFEEHQSGLHKRTRSQFPDASGKFEKSPAQGKGTELKGTELKGTEGKGTELKDRTAAAPPRVRNDNTNGNGNHVVSPSALAEDPNGDNYHVIAALTREVIAEGVPEADLVDVVKFRASMASIDYGRITGEHDVVHRAVSSELFKARHPELVKS